MNSLVTKYIYNVEVRLNTAEGYCGTKTTKKKIFLDTRLRIGMELIKLGLKIINEGECGWFIEGGDG